MANQLVLSLFSGVGLLDHQFRKQGFVVVSAGDLITGQDIREFTSLPGRFNGVIGGSPCQDFSALKRVKSGYSQEMLNEFIRVVLESDPDWFLLENVSGVPDIEIEGYQVQRIDINQGWFDGVSRLRHIQFGSKENVTLNIERGVMRPDCQPCALASDSRSFSELKYIQGLPQSYNLPDFNTLGKKRAVGNGVPTSIGQVLAMAVKDAVCVTDQGVKNVTHRHPKTVTDRPLKSVTWPEHKIVTVRSNSDVTKCACGCYREIYGRKRYYDATCRKRAQRKRDKVIV